MLFMTHLLLTLHILLLLCSHSFRTSRPDSVASMTSIKQESELMERLRKVEVAEATEQWQNIVRFCKTVSEICLELSSRLVWQN